MDQAESVLPGGRDEGMTLARAFCVLCCLCLLAGCGREVVPSEVVGLYSVKYPYGTEQIRISADGSYEQFFAPNGKPQVTINKGRWELRRLVELDLCLHDPVIVDDAFGRQSAMKKQTGAIWPLHVSRGLRGGIWFSVNADQGFVLRRVE